MTRVLIGAVSVLFLIGYVAWRWKRAGDYVNARQAFQEAADHYFEAMKNDPRWHALMARIQQRYPLSLAPQGAEPSAFVLQYVALADDQGFTYRIDNPNGPTKVVALIARQNPADQRYVSMSLKTGEVREDPAPHGWTYIAPPR